MAADAPMHRLLQGDVGSGKTVVALSALLAAVQGGYQGALMAPTEVLAEQHYLSSRAMLAGLTVQAEGTLTGERPVTTRLLTNRTPAAERRRLVAELEAGECDLLIGTHALLYGDAPIPRLGLAVIDEQHRFGVEQRAMLRARGGDGASVPDVLVMTATPIPRTAAFLIYGDLDKSELREMPRGRTPVTTTWIGPDAVARERAYQLLRDEVAAGRQAFVVCPLVEGSPKIEAKDATAEYERLGAEELAGLRLGLLHGQMKPAEKEAGMAAFRAGDVDVLVATTVVEVGVDVPNATVMIVDGAERFGLSQLHQLRGRVGRGGGASWCFLFGDPATADGEARLQAMADSTDGFLLAERDLEIRGAGEVFGEKQAGFGDLKLGRIPRDARYVEWARKVAEDDPRRRSRSRPARAAAGGGRRPPRRRRRVPLQELRCDHGPCPRDDPRRWRAGAAHAGDRRRGRAASDWSCPRGRGPGPTSDRVKESRVRRARRGPARRGARARRLRGQRRARRSRRSPEARRAALLVDRDPPARRRDPAQPDQHPAWPTGPRCTGAGSAAFLRGRPPEAPFDLVFLDPPYDLAGPGAGPDPRRSWPRPGGLAPDARRRGRAARPRSVRRRCPTGGESSWERVYGRYARRAHRPGCRRPDGLTDRRPAHEEPAAPWPPHSARVRSTRSPSVISTSSSGPRGTSTTSSSR